MIAEDLKLRYKRLIEKQELTEEEKLELKQLNEQLFPGSNFLHFPPSNQLPRDTVTG